MRHRALLGVAAGLMALGLASCGSGDEFLAGGVCGGTASAAAALSNKLAACATTDPTFASNYFPCFDAQACSANLVSCSAADQSVLQAVARCQRDYAGNSDCSLPALSAYNACARTAASSSDGGNALSPACAARFAANQGVCAGPDAGP